MTEDVDETITTNQTLDLTYFITNEEELKYSEEINFNDAESNGEIKYTEGTLWTPDETGTYTIEIGDKELSIKVTDVPDIVDYHWEAPISGLSDGQTLQDGDWEDVIEGIGMGSNGLTYRETVMDGDPGVEGGDSNGFIDSGTAFDEVMGFLDGEMAVGVTFKMDKQDGYMFRLDGESGTSFSVGMGDHGGATNDFSAGAITTVMQDAGGSNFEFESSDRYDDNEVYDFLFTKSGNNADDVEWRINNGPINISNLTDEGYNPDENEGLDEANFFWDPAEQSRREFTGVISRFTYYNRYLPDGEEWRY